MHGPRRWETTPQRSRRCPRLRGLRGQPFPAGDSKSTPMAAAPKRSPSAGSPLSQSCPPPPSLLRPPSSLPSSSAVLPCPELQTRLLPSLPRCPSGGTGSFPPTFAVTWTPVHKFWPQPHAARGRTVCRVLGRHDEQVLVLGSPQCRGQTPTVMRAAVVMGTSPLPCTNSSPSWPGGRQALAGP